MRRLVPPRANALTVGLAFAALSFTPSRAVPTLTDPSVGTLELVTLPSEASKLNFIDGLAFDSFGNLFGCLEAIGSAGGVVYIDKATGLVTTLVTGISRADQIALHPSGDFFLTSELFGASTTNRVYRLTVGYDVNNVPQAATTTAASLTTSLAIDDPEGLIVLDGSGPFGNAGDLYIAEDRDPGEIFHVDPSTGTATVLAGGLRRPEGMAFGDFGGASTPALYAAETTDDNVIRIDSNGTASVTGNPAGVSLNNPDNVEFGPDGFLYTTEDLAAPSSRVIRIAPDGTHSVFATGFGQAQGMVFDANGDFYITEQDSDRVWRVVWTATGAPDVGPATEPLSLRASPNPFRSATTIRFDLPGPAEADVSVYDIGGRLVQVLLRDRLPAGSHDLRWRGDGVPPGVYLVRLRAGRETATTKLLRIR